MVSNFSFSKFIKRLLLYITTYRFKLNKERMFFNNHNWQVLHFPFPEVKQAQYMSFWFVCFFLFLIFADCSSFTDCSFLLCTLTEQSHDTAEFNMPDPLHQLITAAITVCAEFSAGPEFITRLKE